MSSRTRKFVGLFVTLLWLFAYCVVLVGLAVRILPGASGLIQLLFYFVGGLAWTVPLFPLIAWMNRPENERRLPPAE